MHNLPPFAPLSRKEIAKWYEYQQQWIQNCMLDEVTAVNRPCQFLTILSQWSIKITRIKMISLL